MRKAFRWCEDFRLAVDVGAHIGLWSRDLSVAFRHVMAFEPVDENFSCLAKNVPANVSLHKVALSNSYGYGTLRKESEGNSGAWTLIEGTDHYVCLLDEYELSYLDFLKIDVQGHEKKVLMGAEETLKRCNPVVVVETTLNDEKSDMDFLKGLGAVLRVSYGKDAVYSWD